MCPEARTRATHDGLAPTVLLEPADGGAGRVALGNLMQLYQYDWSELGPYEVDEQGRFAAYPYLDAYWTEAFRHPFVIRSDGRIAGFALIMAKSQLTGTEGIFDMAEFFVLRRHRRRGIGAAAAYAAFDRFPGPWEIRQRVANTAATAFWRRVIDGYTGGRYTESHHDDPRWTGPVQSFASAR